MGGSLWRKGHFFLLKYEAAKGLSVGKIKYAWTLQTKHLGVAGPFSSRASHSQRAHLDKNARFPHLVGRTLEGGPKGTEVFPTKWAKALKQKIRQNLITDLDLEAAISERDAVVDGGMMWQGSALWSSISNKQGKTVLMFQTYHEGHVLNILRRFYHTSVAAGKSAVLKGCVSRGWTQNGADGWGKQNFNWKRKTDVTQL